MFKIKTHISSFFLLWLTVVSISICLAILIAAPLGDFLYTNNGLPPSATNDGFTEGTLSIIFLVGLFMGFGQWVVLNTKIKKSHGWILATLFGFFVGSFISFFIFAFVEGILSNLGIYDYDGWIQMIGTFMGAGMFTGVCQWVSLKGRIAGSLKWSLVTGVSFVIGILSISLVPFSFSFFSTINPIAWINPFIIFSILIALISGYFVEPLIIYPEVKNFGQQKIAT
ncbi:MAG: hypothetical protein HZB50_06845 [Chloroflexi bacterium]|nr:hypothetical protein [Chloroflexota bacterium]